MIFACIAAGGTGSRMGLDIPKQFAKINGKPIILAFDNLSYVRMTPAIDDMMTSAWTGYPYDGAKEHYVLDIEHRDKAMKVVHALLAS